MVMFLQIYLNPCFYCQALNMESFASSGIKVLYSIYSTQYNLLYIHEPIIFPGVHCTVLYLVRSWPPGYYVRYNI